MEIALFVSDQVASDLPRASELAMLPEIHRLPGAQQQATVLNAERHGLAGECRSDVRRHVVIAFIVVEVTATLTLGICWPSPVLRDNSLHPSG